MVWECYRTEFYIKGEVTEKQIKDLLITVEKKYMWLKKRII